MKKYLVICFVIVLALSLTLTGCGPKTVIDVDAVTTASIVNHEDDLAVALSKNGNWIVAVVNDIYSKKDIVIEGDFHNKGDAASDLYRKLALYSQDEDHNVTARFTLAAKKLTITSPNTKIQGGTFKGDVYVRANGFTVQDATIDGNVYFSSQEYKDSFVLPTDEGKKGIVTGSVKVK